jgi:hypothetical protein
MVPQTRARGNASRGIADGVRSLIKMASSDRFSDLIGDDEVAFRLELTPPQLRVTYTALKLMLDGFGHDEEDVHRIVREVLAKLPEAESIESINLHLPRRRRRL